MGWTAFEEREPERGACLYGRILIWHTYRGVITEDWEKRRATPMYTHWMPIPRKGWIRTKDRIPGKEDGDNMGCVLARDERDGILMTGWHQFAHRSTLTHWTHTPDPPEDRSKYYSMDQGGN